MTIADKINIGLLVVAVMGIALTFLQVRKGARIQRAQFLKELYLTMTADPDICQAYYLIEYDKFEYATFHDSAVEPKLDRLLGFADLVAESYLQSAISEREMSFFRYRFQRIYENAEIPKYLTYLAAFYSSVGVAKVPFHSFQNVANKFTSKTRSE